MIPLSQVHSYLLRRGMCPHCQCSRLLNGPTGGEARDVLCIVCHREYCVAPVGLGYFLGECAPDRLSDIYGLSEPKEAA